MSRCALATNDIDVGLGFGQLHRLELSHDRFEGQLRNGVGRDHLAQQGDHLRVGDQRPAARAGQPVSLGERSQNGEMRKLG